MLALLAQVVLSPEDTLRIAKEVEAMWNRGALVTNAVVMGLWAAVWGWALYQTQNRRVQDSDARTGQLITLTKELGEHVNESVASSANMLRAIEENRRVGEDVRRMVEELLRGKRRTQDPISKPAPIGGVP